VGAEPRSSPLASKAKPKGARAAKAKPKAKPAARAKRPAPPSKTAKKTPPKPVVKAKAPARLPAKAPSKPPAKPPSKSGTKKGAEPAAESTAIPLRGDGRRHLLSLSFLRDGEEFTARLETDAGQITELKNRSLDQLLTLVASELEDLLE
jgi:hypothetical protein